MFRDILRKYKEAYRVAETKREKRDIVAKAIEEFKSTGGRFLDKVVLPSHETSGNNKHCYEIVEGPAVSLKARQAFRYLLRGTEIDDDDDPRGRNTSSEQNSMVRVDSASQKHRPPTISNSPVGTSGLASFEDTTRPILPPSQMEEHARAGGELTSKDVMDIQRLASLVSDAPMLASIGTSSYYCPTSPWRQQGLIPLSLQPSSMRKISDTASPGNPEMLLNSMKFGESWATGNANTIPGLLTSEILGHGGQYPTGPDMSLVLVARAKLLDSYLLEKLYHSTTTDALYRRLVSSERPSSQQEESRIMIEEQRAVARAMMEHRRRENRLAALVVPDLQRVMMLDNQGASPRSTSPLRRQRDLERSHQQGATYLHNIMKEHRG